MRLSTKGKYALEAMVLLGHKAINGNTIHLKTISTQANISEGYLEQIFRLLKKENVISSKKGKNGGYFFDRSLDQISVGDILNAVEGSLAPVKCVEDEICNRSDECLTRDLWEDVFILINDTINNISLLSLIKDYRLKQSLGEKSNEIID